jgi:hypothetical protein
MPLLIASELGVVGVSLWLALLAIGAGMIWNTTFDPFGVGVAAGAVSLVMIGMADKYPWTIMHFGLLLWGCLGAAMRPQQ